MKYIIIGLSVLIVGVLLYYVLVVAPNKKQLKQTQDQGTKIDPTVGSLTGIGGGTNIAGNAAAAVNTASTALATAAHPVMCAAKCSALHPWSKSKRLACEQNCKQTGLAI